MQFVVTHLRNVFGQKFSESIEKYDITFEQLKEIINKNALKKFSECKNWEQYKVFFRIIFYHSLKIFLMNHIFMRLKETLKNTRMF